MIKQKMPDGVVENTTDNAVVDDPVLLIFENEHGDPITEVSVSSKMFEKLVQQAKDSSISLDGYIIDVLRTAMNDS